MLLLSSWMYVCPTWRVWGVFMTLNERRSSKIFHERPHLPSEIFILGEIGHLSFGRWTLLPPSLLLSSMIVFWSLFLLSLSIWIGRGNWVTTWLSNWFQGKRIVTKQDDTSLIPRENAIRNNGEMVMWL